MKQSISEVRPISFRFVSFGSPPVLAVADFVFIAGTSNTFRFYVMVTPDIRSIEDLPSFPRRRT